MGKKNTEIVSETADLLKGRNLKKPADQEDIVAGMRQSGLLSGNIEVDEMEFLERCAEADKRKKKK